MNELAPLNLGRTARAGLEALVGVVTPAGEAEQLGVFQATVAETVLTMRAMPLSIRVSLAAGMWAYELLSVLVPRNGLKRASRLGPALAERYYRSWKYGLALQVNFIKGIKGLIGLAYYEQLPVQDHIGYGPRPWIETARRKRLELYADAIAEHQTSLLAPDPLPLPSQVAADVAALPAGEREASLANRPLGERMS